VPTSRKPSVVIFTIHRDGVPTECAGRLHRDLDRAYADNCVEVESGAPLPQAIVQLDRKSLRRGTDAQQGQNRCHYSRIVVLDQ
jgi:hypothetical protein